MNTSTIFDIETTGAPDAELALVKPQFKAPGNYKDPAKIAEAIAAAETDWKEKAALSAVTGRILAIGLLTDGKPLVIEGAEKDILGAFWDHWSGHNDKQFIGWSCRGFDVPFLIRRSWALQVDLPAYVFEGRYLSPRFVDLADTWCCGNRDQKESLDTVCKALGLGAKNGDGKDFGRLWIEDKPKALDYLANDIALTAALAVRMGYSL